MTAMRKPWRLERAVVIAHTMMMGNPTILLLELAGCRLQFMACTSCPFSCCPPTKSLFSQGREPRYSVLTVTSATAQTRRVKPGYLSALPSPISNPTFSSDNTVSAITFVFATPTERLISSGFSLQASPPSKASNQKHEPGHFGTTAFVRIGVSETVTSAAKDIYQVSEAATGKLSQHGLLITRLLPA